MKAPAAAIWFATIAAAGCAPQPVWDKPGIDQAENRRDHSWCASYAQMEVNYLPDNLRFTAWSVEREAFETCMRGKGYRTVPQS